MKKGLILLSALLCMVALTGCRKTINLEDYVSIDVKGCDGYAVAEVNVDELGIAQQVAEAQGQSVNFDSLDGLFASINIYNSVERILDNSTLILSNDQYISNGDELRVDIKYNNKALKGDKVKLAGSCVKYTVNGLAPIQELNPFDFLTVSFDGYDGIGKARASYDGPHAREFLYELSQRDNLSNGDVITVDISSDKETELNGFLITEYSKEYQVSGLDKVTDYNPLNYVTVEFSGNNGEGKAKVKYSGEHSEDFDFVIDKKTELSNGEIVTLSLDDIKDSTYKGYHIVGTEVTFTVSGLKEAFALSSIAEEDFNELYEFSKSVADEELLSKYKSSSSGLVFEDPECLGYYYTGGISNYCYYVFKTYLDYKSNNFNKTGTYYLVVGLKNVTYDKDGILTYQLLEKRWCDTMDEVEDALMRYTEDKTEAETFEKTVALPSDYRLVSTKDEFAGCTQIVTEPVTLLEKYTDYLASNNTKYTIVAANHRIADCLCYVNNVENRVVVITACEIYYEGRTSDTFTLYVPFEYSNVRINDSGYMINGRPTYGEGTSSHKGTFSHYGTEKADELYKSIAKKHAAFELIQ